MKPKLSNASSSTQRQAFRNGMVGAASIIENAKISLKTVFVAALLFAGLAFGQGAESSEKEIALADIPHADASSEISEKKSSAESAETAEAVSDTGGNASGLASAEEAAQDNSQAALAENSPTTIEATETTETSTTTAATNSDNREKPTETEEELAKEKPAKKKNSKTVAKTKNAPTTSRKKKLHADTKLFEMVKAHSQRPEVVAWREKFLEEKRFKFVKRSAENHPEYRIHVRKAVRERGLPAELEYLPIIESGYNTRARSYSGAVGMWQFMANSVWPYLKLNEYVDERLDPWKSTVAGLRKLEDNYKIYGDWLLAIAAYNCGNGKMGAAIKKSGGIRDFWELAAGGFLPKQTADYVPELIAVAEICVNPQLFEVELAYFDEEYAAIQAEEELFDFVTIKKPYVLSSIADKIKVEQSLFAKLNPSFTKGFTHPAEESVLRLPKGMEELFMNSIDHFKLIEFPLKYHVVKGDSLWSISRKFGVSIKLLCDTNGIKESSILKINQLLYIPSMKK